MQELTRAISNFYDSNRGVGHTTAIIRSINSTDKNCIFLVANSRQKSLFKKMIINPKCKIMTAKEFPQQSRGGNGTLLFIDNLLIHNITGDTATLLDKIINYEKELTFLEKAQ